MYVGIRAAILSSLLATSGVAFAAGGSAGTGENGSQASDAITTTQEGVGGSGARQQDENSGPDVVGRLVDVSPAAETIKIRDPETNHIVELQLEDETRLEVDGEPGDLDDLREGEPIRASFELVEDEMVARSVRQGKPQPVERSATGAVEEPAATVEDVEFEGPSPGAAGPNPVELEQ